MDAIQKELLMQVADLHEIPEGAYNIRSDGQMYGRNTTANIDIVSKEDKDGIDIIIKPGTKNESIHIPVLLSESRKYLWSGKLSEADSTLVQPAPLAEASESEKEEVDEWDLKPRIIIKPVVKEVPATPEPPAEKEKNSGN